MCCRRGPRRQSTVVALGQFAYKKYQERQHQHAVTAGPSTALARRSSPPPHVLEHNANSEILEKAGIAPPSYDDVVIHSPKNRSKPKDEKDSDDSDGLSDAESFFEVNAHGERQSSAEMEAAQADFIREWKLHRGGAVAGEEAPVLTKWQQKRAEWAIRKAERAAKRADRAAMGW